MRFFTGIFVFFMMVGMWNVEGETEETQKILFKERLPSGLMIFGAESGDRYVVHRRVREKEIFGIFFNKKDCKYIQTALFVCRFYDEKIDGIFWPKMAISLLKAYDRGLIDLACETTYVKEKTVTFCDEDKIKTFLNVASLIVLSKLRFDPDNKFTHDEWLDQYYGQ